MRLPQIVAAIRACTAPVFGGEVYFSDFNGAPGAPYPEWISSGYTNTSNRAVTVAAGRGTPVVTTTASPNGRQRFLGEFGGPAILTERPFDPQHFVRVDQTVTLTLRNLKPHTVASVTVDLYILKSWDGNNSNYGPDRWSLKIQGGPTLLEITFSNNPKTGAYDLSLQNYPVPNSARQTLVLNFSSSLFEGKGIADESWGWTMYEFPSPGRTRLLACPTLLFGYRCFRCTWSASCPARRH